MSDQAQGASHEKILAVSVVSALLPLCANDGTRFGAQFSINVPVGAVRQLAKSGPGLGLFVTQSIGDGHAVAVRLNLSALEHKSKKTTSYDLKKLREDLREELSGCSGDVSSNGLDYKKRLLANLQP
jgi:hypothetical protein